MKRATKREDDAPRGAGGAGRGVPSRFAQVYERTISRLPPARSADGVSKNTKADPFGFVASIGSDAPGYVAAIKRPDGRVGITAEYTLDFLKQVIIPDAMAMYPGSELVRIMTVAERDDLYRRLGL